jgi:zinc transport system substrate-binding protein
MIPVRSIARLAAAVGLATAALAGLQGCERNDTAPPARPAVAVANSFLGAAARDLVGDAANIVELAPPGTCPGHFDIRPSQIEALRACRALFRFDFQSGLDQKLAPLADDGLLIQSIEVEHGLCTPTAYINACRQVGTALTHKQLITAREHAERVTAIQERMVNLTDRVQADIAAAGLAGLRVIASPHQRDFCELLGLEVVTTLGGSDTTSVGDINAALAESAAVQAVIANLPEGRRLADALGQRLNVPVIVFGNFPDQARHHGQFDELVLSNATRLIQALSE